MGHWLVKSEPGSWSWDDQVKAGTTDWSGVRNPQATNFMKAMKKGDRAFFYHSGEERRIVGVIEVVKEFYPDPKDKSGRFGLVDVKTVGPVLDEGAVERLEDQGLLARTPDRLVVLPRGRLLLDAILAEIAL